MGYNPALFVDCAATTRVIIVFKFSRPEGFDALRHVV